MTQVCTYGKHNPAGHPAGLATNAILKTDPTRTTTLRAKFVADVERRFKKLKSDIRTSIITNDCFGIQPEVVALSPVRPKAYEFKRTADKIDAFMLWLEEQEAAGVLEIIRKPGGLRGMYEAWSDTYIYSAYAKGIRRSRGELKKAGYDVTSIDDVRRGVAGIMNQPFHADRLAVLYTRTFDDLKSVTQVMNASIRRQIADGLTTGLTRGLAEGRSPIVIARHLYKDVANHVDKIGRVRCRMIARTEIVRAHHLATIQEYRQADADMEVGVKAEFSTSGLPTVCPICIDLEDGGPYSLDVAEGMIPVHPNCVSAETTVLAPDKIAGFVATYTGSIIKIRFASGRRLSVTPNHMLLTPHGFTFAKSFSKGDHVISCSDFERIITVDPDDDRNPARIDNIVKAFAKSSRMSAHRMPAAAEYLHGDGKFCEGNIDIVGTDSFLRDDPNAIRAEQMDKLGFETGGRFAKFFSFGALTELLKATAFAADSSMCRFREAFAADWAFALHSDDSSLTRTAETKPNGEKYTLDWRSTAPVALRKCLDRFTGFIELDEVIDVEIESVSHLKVYDLQCESTMYIANGILSSNCKCCVLPVVIEKSNARRAA
jgi:hypothetical protein